jgi:hypothetical protein
MTEEEVTKYKQEVGYCKDRMCCLCKYRGCEYIGNKMVIVCNFDDSIKFEVDWYAHCNNFTV